MIAIPLAALGYLNPLFAGIAMAASSLIVTRTACGCAGSGGAACGRGGPRVAAAAAAGDRAP